MRLSIYRVNDYWAARVVIAWATFAALFIWTLFIMVTLRDPADSADPDSMALAMAPILVPGWGLMIAGVVAIGTSLVARRLFLLTRLDRVNAFAQILADRGVVVSVRKSRGRDIRAACGQLITESARQQSPGQRLAQLMPV